MADRPSPHPSRAAHAARVARAFVCLMGAASVAFGGSAGAQEAPASPGPSASATPPVVLTHVDAEYPTSALASRKHADVVVAVTVDADGHVRRRST